MQIAIVGATDFTLRPRGSSTAKYPEAQDAAEEFVRGFIESLPRNTIIVAGGLKQGVDAWVRKYFDTYKDKRRYKIIEHLPIHERGKPHYEVEVTLRNKNIVEDAKNGLFAIIPEEGEIEPYLAKLLMGCRMAHIAHTLVKLKPSGDIANLNEISAFETFDKEKQIALPRSARPSEPNSITPNRSKGRRGSGSPRTITLKRRRKLSAKVPLSHPVAGSKRRSNEHRGTRSVVRGSTKVRGARTDTALQKGKRQTVVLSKKKLR